MRTRPTSSPPDDYSVVSDLIGLAYDAAGDGDLWVTFLERIAQTLELRAVNFMISASDAEGSVVALPRAWGYDEDQKHAYESHFGEIDLRRRQACKLAPGTVAVGDQLLAEREFVETEYFNDFYAPIGLRYEFGSVIHNDSRALNALVCYRGPDHGPASPHDLELLRLLTPHLQRARALAVKLGTISNQARMSADVLHRLAAGLIFFDEEGAVVGANATAERLLADEDGLAVSKGRLQAARPVDSRSLAAIMSEAIRPDDRLSARGPMSIRLPRPSGRRSLEVMACAIDPASRVWSQGRAAGFLVVSSGEAQLHGVARRLRDLYGLSEAESQLVVALANGSTLKDWAATRGVSIETVRWQLKQVFAKTGTTRQPELMRLVLLGPALIP